MSEYKVGYEPWEGDSQVDSSCSTVNKYDLECSKPLEMKNLPHITISNTEPLDGNTLNFKFIGKIGSTPSGVDDGFDLSPSFASNVDPQTSIFSNLHVYDHNIPQQGNLRVNVWVNDPDNETEWAPVPGTKVSDCKILSNASPSPPIKLKHPVGSISSEAINNLQDSEVTISYHSDNRWDASYTITANSASRNITLDTGTISPGNNISVVDTSPPDEDITYQLTLDNGYFTNNEINCSDSSTLLEMPDINLDFRGDRNVILVGESTTFDSGSSTGDTGKIDTYSWSFPDNSTSTSPRPNYTFSSLGQKDIKLDVTTNNNYNLSKTKSYDVKPSLEVLVDNNNQTKLQGEHTTGDILYDGVQFQTQGHAGLAPLLIKNRSDSHEYTSIILSASDSDTSNNFNLNTNQDITISKVKDLNNSTISEPSTTLPSGSQIVQFWSGSDPTNYDPQDSNWNTSANITLGPGEAKAVYCLLINPTNDSGVKSDIDIEYTGDFQIPEKLTNLEKFDNSDYLVFNTTSSNSSPDLVNEVQSSNLIQKVNWNGTSTSDNDPDEDIFTADLWATRQNVVPSEPFIEFNFDLDLDLADSSNFSSSGNTAYYEIRMLGNKELGNSSNYLSLMFEHDLLSGSVSLKLNIIENNTQTTIISLGSIASNSFSTDNLYFRYIYSRELDKFFFGLRLGSSYVLHTETVDNAPDSIHPLSSGGNITVHTHHDITTNDDYGLVSNELNINQIKTNYSDI